MYGLEINNLTVELGTFRLDDINLGIRKGCITGLIGKNGAGKSTLIKTIMRQNTANRGSILYNGLRFAEHEVQVLKMISCVFDTPHFNTNMKPKSLFNLYSAIYPGFDVQLYEELMSKFKLPENLRVRKFSYGMQRKYSIILAMCQRPEILILDEPTSGIDPYDRNEIVGLIQEYMMNEEHTVLFSTHITEDLDKIADYIVMMDNGRITINEEKNSLVNRYRLVQCGEITDKMRAHALGIRKSMFGFTFLTSDLEISGEGIIVKVPTLEEIFIHTFGMPQAPFDHIENPDIFKL